MIPLNFFILRRVRYVQFGSYLKVRYVCVGYAQGLRWVCAGFAHSAQGALGNVPPLGGAHTLRSATGAR